jgi:hypothetical protein
MLNVKEKSVTGTLAELYNTDYYTWAMTNAELLKEGRFDEIDYINLAEEVKDLGKSEYYKLESFLANLLSHLYKWDNQPELRTKSWINTIANSIRGISQVLKENPGLKYQYTFDKVFTSAWENARYIIFSDTEIKFDLISEKSPYTFKESVQKASEITGIQNQDIFFLNNLF